MSMTLIDRAAGFSGGPATECPHDHKLQGTGAVFFQSVGLLRCSLCYGWQLIRKPVSITRTPVNSSTS